MSERLRLGDMLVAAGMVTADHVLEALAEQKETGRRVGETLVDLGYVTEPQMIQVLSNQLSVPWVNLYHVDFSRELLDLVPAELAERYSLVPVYVRHVRRQGDTLYVAMDDPLNVTALQEVADHSGLPVKPMVAPPSDIRDAIRVYYLGLPPMDEVEEEPVEEILLTPDAEEEPEERAAASASAEREDEGGPTARPSVPPGSAKRRPGLLTLTLLDGTKVRLPAPGAGRRAKSEPRGLTTRDLVHALQARAAGEDVEEVLPDDALEILVASLLSVLLRKGLLADWEFVEEWQKQRRKRSRRDQR